MIKTVLGWPRPVKRLIALAADSITALMATWLAFTLRLDTPHVPTTGEWVIYAVSVLLAIPVFIRFGLYRSIFRYTGLATAIATVKAIAVYALCFGAVLFLLWSRGVQGSVPRSLALLQPLIFLVLVGTTRAAAKGWLGGTLARKHPRRRLLIYGAGAAGVQTAAALSSSREFVLIGFIDDDRSKVGQNVNGVRVYAGTEVGEVAQRFGVTDILLALPSVGRQRRSEIIDRLHGVPVHIRTLPGIMDLASGRVTVQDFHELDIEDLLGREAVPPERALLAKEIRNEVIMVTGAGGSIGSELCRQILKEQPRQLVLVDHNEFGLYSIHRELEEFCAAAGSMVTLVPLLASVQSMHRMLQICHDFRPSIIYHAAAYKHVPLVESNAGEAVLNNIFGTVVTARAALECRARHLVLVSTDKAVRPTNVMGATKRVAEQVMQALAAEREVDFGLLLEGAAAVVQRQTCLSMVRFGNVLGSSGSVVPLFRRQIAAGGPLTLTHPEVTRYFMTIPEAAQLVLQAGAMSRGGEVFVLDMGEPVRIYELARKMVTLSGLTVRDEADPTGDIEIAITGLRPGEKLHEELLIGADPIATGHPRIMKASEAYTPWPQLAAQLKELRRAALADNLAHVEDLLRALVPESRLSAALAETASGPD